MMKLEQIGKDEWAFADDTIPGELHDQFDAALDAWQDEGKIAVAEKALLGIIVCCPDHIDALHHLALLYQDSARDALAFACWQAAVGVGLRAFPDEFSWQRSRLDWGFLENRPFMRAYHALGLWFRQYGHHADAIEVFSRLLAVCPNDNLGTRYILPECWFGAGEPAKVIAHCQTHGDDGGPDIQYSLGLALVMCGKVESAKQVLEGAVSRLPLVAKELLKKSHRRPAGYNDGYVSWGGADQGYDYWQRVGKHWQASEKAMHLLKVVARSQSAG